MKVLLGALLCLVLHLALGWQWTVLGGAVVGWWSLRRGWLCGAAAVSLEWASLIAYSYVVAPEQVSRLHATMGAFSKMPPWAFPVAAIAVAALLGTAGGLVGQMLVPLLHRGKR